MGEERGAKTNGVKTSMMVEGKRLDELNPEKRGWNHSIVFR